MSHEAQLHSVGIPYKMCFGGKWKEAEQVVLGWLDHRYRRRIVFTESTFTPKTQDFIRTLALVALERGIPVRYVIEPPPFINEGWLYIFPYTDKEYIKSLMKICLTEAFAWCFSTLGFSPSEFPYLDFIWETSISNLSTGDSRFLQLEEV